jgi:predicted dehydrogenase
MIRVGVVGAGIMGSNHARVLNTLPNATVTLIVDTDEDRGRTLAKSVGAEYSCGLEAAFELCDAAIVASTSHTHLDIGVPLLQAGIDVLVEKPIATTAEDAQILIDAAEANSRILMTGHIERFNPAVLELDRLINNPLHIELTRMGPYSPRVKADVVLDLMIHDLELALALSGSEVESVSAIGRREKSDSLDLAVAILRFRNGVTATVTASRIGQTKVRLIELTQRTNYVVVDLIRQDVTVNRVDHNEFLSEGGSRYRQTGLVEIPFLENRGEPLALELTHFLSSVETRNAPRVTGEDGRRALELALKVRDLADAGS